MNRFIKVSKYKTIMFYFVITNILILNGFLISILITVKMAEIHNAL